MAHGDVLEGKWMGNWRMEWVANTLHTTSEHGVSSITTADAHTSAPGSRLNWRPRLFKWTRPFRRKTKSGFCACAITFQMQSNIGTSMVWWTIIRIFKITFKSLVRETGMYSYWSVPIIRSCEEAWLADYMKSTKYIQNYIYFRVVLHFFLSTGKFSALTWTSG